MKSAHQCHPNAPTCMRCEVLSESYENAVEAAYDELHDALPWFLLDLNAADEDALTAILYRVAHRRVDDEQQAA